MYRPIAVATVFLATTLSAPAQDLDLQSARGALMGQLDLLIASVDEKLTAGGDLDPARYEMEYAAAMIATIPWLFPAPTEAHPQDEFSNAAPAIWTDFDQFAALNQQAKDAAEAAAFSSDAEELRTSFEAVKAACAACHDGFVLSAY